MLQSTQIKPKYYQLKFRFFYGDKIVPMDDISVGGIISVGKKKSDAYV